MLRRLVLPVYLPVVLVNGGTAMLAPVLPLYLRSIGLSSTSLGVIIAAAGVGGMLSQVAIGELLSKQSETRVMVASVSIIAATVALLGVVGAAVALAALRLGSGIGSAGWLLSRQTFLTRAVDPLLRGRAMAMFGGTTRVAFLIGPVVGGIIAQFGGYPLAFAVSAATTFAGAIPILIWHKRSTDQSVTTHEQRIAVDRPPLRPHARILAIAGFGQILIVAVRQGRFLILPLIGAQLGMLDGEIGLLIGIGAAADLLLFPISGVLMDRFGRLLAIGPSLAIMGVGLGILALADRPATVTAAALVIGVGNGLGSGTMLTLSSDLAPAASPSGFLAALGTIRDGGRIVGPILVGWIADVAGLAWSALMLGGLAFAALAIFVFGVGETRAPVVAPHQASS